MFGVGPRGGKAALLKVLLIGGAFGLALALRWRGLGTAQVLGDSVGPWWRAASDQRWRPHAPLFGWGLNLPYTVILGGVASLWSAVRALFVVHALAAPLGVLLVLGRSGRAWGAAALVGLTVALDPGLIDTTTSGARAYLGPCWAGVMALGVGLQRPGRAGLLAGFGFGFAVMNHPFSLCLAPLLLTLPAHRRAALGLLPGLLLPLPGLGGLFEVAAAQPSQGSAALLQDAVTTFFEVGGAASLFIAGGLIVGLLSARTRPLALATVAAAALLCAAGFGVAHLRDYHLRLLSLPALAGWAALTGPGPLLGLLLLRPPPDPEDGADALRRPGSLALETRIADRLYALPARPLVVDGAWISASPAAEPGAVMLDLALRGVPVDDLRPGGVVVVIASGERADLARTVWPLPLLDEGDRHRVFAGTEAQVRAWSTPLCDHHPRLGGAWDGLAALHTALDAAVVGRWWACP